jgi:hypothetical protein
MKTASERLAKRRKICLQYLIRWVGRKTLIILLICHVLGLLILLLYLRFLSRFWIRSDSVVFCLCFSFFFKLLPLLAPRGFSFSEQRDENSKRKACKKKKNLSAIPH